MGPPLPSYSVYTNRGMGRLVSIFYNQLALLLAEKCHQPYATMMEWLWFFLSFPYCAHQFCASVALNQIKTTFLDFLHPLIWLSVNHVLLANLLTFSTIISTFYVCKLHMVYIIFLPLQYSIVGLNYIHFMHAPCNLLYWDVFQFALHV